MKKEEFKEFVRNNPKLIKYVKNNEMTWQKFYEMYDLYGDNENAWKEYLTESDNKNKTLDDTMKTGLSGLTLSEMVKWFKNVDLNSLQEGIGNVQRVLGVVQDLSNKNETKETQTQTYKPRPLYKHFED